MSDVIICRDCELKQTLPHDEAGWTLRCFRCGAVLKRLRPHSFNTLAAWSIAALILWFTANTMPFLTFGFKGGTTVAFLWSGAFMLWEEGFRFLSALVLMTSIVMPLLHISLIAVTVIGLGMGFRGWRLAYGIRLINWFGNWAMPGIYLIGVSVAAVKIGQLAALSPGPGVYALAAMVLIWISITASTDADVLFDLWEDSK
ncbi:MAG: paraquat-inducible protein A [Myxococcota bacterium]|nr:paraquat-inducible protein A [Myxococcota bacterium]